MNIKRMQASVKADVDNMVGKRWSWDFDGGERVVIG